MNARALLLFLLILMLACNDHDRNDLHVITSHPMDVGTEWIYNRNVIIKSFESETSGKVIGIDTFRYITKVCIEKDTILNGRRLKVFKSIDSSLDASFREYKSMDDDGLKTYAYTTFCVEPHASGDISFLKFSMLRNALFAECLIHETIPVLDIQLPLSLDSYWIYRQPNESGGLQIEKKVVGIESIRLNRRSFNCYKVEWIYINDPLFTGLSVTDWISDMGLIQRITVNERSTLVSDVMNPLFQRNVQIIEELSLHQLHLK